MTRFYQILKRKLTIGNSLTIIGSFIFAIAIRHLYLNFFDFLPVRGELEALDISYFGIVMLFKFIFSAFLEYLLNDKFSIPLFEAIGQGVGEKKVTTLAMVNSEGSSAENSSKGKNTATKQQSERESEREKSHKFIEDKHIVGDKMWNVLKEQGNSISRLREFKTQNGVQFYEQDGSLDITVPTNMSETEGEKIAKKVGAIDRSLQNKFSEYNNLSRKDVRLYESF